MERRALRIIRKSLTRGRERVGKQKKNKERTREKWRMERIKGAHINKEIEKSY
jgi:hypothetical protein